MVMRVADCQRGRVLFVCKDAAMLQELGSGVHDHGYEVQTALDWHSAVDFVRSWDPKVVLTDFPENSVPVQSFSTRLRAESNLQILALLRDRRGPLRMAALAAGADDYIFAPFTMPELPERRVVACGQEQHLAAEEIGYLACSAS
jgi:DNA-binding response OmpR family regulator